MAENQSELGAVQNPAEVVEPSAEPWGPYLVTLVQLALAGVAIFLLELEQRAGLPQLIPVVVVAFAIHARAPMRYRPALFVLASIAGLFAVMKEDAVWVLGAGTVLFGLCSLPVKVWARAVLVVGAAAALSLYRIDGTFGWTAAALPVLGGMFMYRGIVFLFDENASGRQSTLAQRFGYFFMLPAVCFPLFPVVDYRLWRTQYFRGEVAELYQKGIGWIIRGLMQMVLYRVIYHFLVLPEWEIVDSTSALRAMATVYPTYLRISGQFHVIVGVLLLFGYNLPETNRRYFFATSFLDLWRRANIYWKDFMQKVVFFPFFLRLRRMGAPKPMILAIALTFIATWFLHSYQWFWLRGDFPLTIQDAVFWTVIGTFVAIDSVRETKRPRRRGAAASGFVVSEAAIHVMKVVWMFTAMCALWSFWTAPSLEIWGELVSLLGQDFEWVFWYLGAVALALAVGIPGLYFSTRGPKGWDGLFPPVTVRTSAPVLAGLLALGLLPRAGLVEGDRAEVLAALTTQKLNQQDALTQVRGYYENLLVRNGMMSELAMADVGRPEVWSTLSNPEHTRKTNDLRGSELMPNVTAVHRGETFSTNQWGMRDKEYTKKKPAGTFRIALLGSSYAMGVGVKDKHVFENLVEDWLNDRYAGGKYERYEILNFAKEGYLLISTVGQCMEMVPSFEPDLVILIDHAMQPKRLAKRMSRSDDQVKFYPKPWLNEWLERNGVTAGTNDREDREQMWVSSAELPGNFLRDAVELCTRDGAKAAWMWLPVNKPSHPEYAEVRTSQKAVAESLDMVTLTLDGAYGDHTVDELSIASWDEHPNPLGHRLLADAMMRQLEQNSEALGLGLRK
ncbi:MAG: hypothetical protein CL927_14570 [Deltaproteobacteria bacterium]|nr:hypothetical protein [Deltaproteobacteria bacterium]HCH63818.1 hypothetical protein [Deltaproteobacteria bacterium]